MDHPGGLLVLHWGLLSKTIQPKLNNLMASSRRASIRMVDINEAAQRFARLQN